MLSVDHARDNAVTRTVPPIMARTRSASQSRGGAGTRTVRSTGRYVVSPSRVVASHSVTRRFT
ncbi:hypothetical protein L1885_01215 [Streptomyces fuscigenes]|nr:hypothetical protein [Streptomyces fuscigenes]